MCDSTPSARETSERARRSLPKVSHGVAQLPVSFLIREPPDHTHGGDVWHTSCYMRSAWVSCSKPLRDNERFMQTMTGLERPLLGVAAGTIATIAIQSSSAMLGIVITLATQGLLTLPAGLAIMLGAEIGTCADTLVASIGRTRAAVRAGIFHLGFNVMCAAVGVLLIEQLAALSRALPGGDSLPRQIANAHVAFNVLGVAAFLPFTAMIARLLERLLPDRPAAAAHHHAA